MFDQELASWQSCYVAMAAASATLAGLLFVALSLHARTMRDPKSANVRRLAEHTFRDFIRCLVVSLFLLIPKFDPASLAIVVAMLGLSGVVWVGKTLLDTRRDRVATQHGRYLMRRLGLSLIADAFLVFAGIAILMHSTTGNYWMALFAGPMMLLISSTRNAWFILVHELS